MATQTSGAPRASLSVLDGALMMVGIIIGIGIFKTPQLVATFSPNEWTFVGLWIAGGLTTLIGALVYAELAAAYPSTGGEYHFLTRALGPSVGFLFAWARTTVIQTGAIAAVAFVLGDYAQEILPLGSYGPAIYAGAGLLILTLINISGTYESKTAQNILTTLLVAAMLAIVIIGFMNGGSKAAAPAAGDSGYGMVGLAMVFILLTYGGWNEAAYLSADVRNVRRDMVRILLIGTAIVTSVYVLVNIAYLMALGLEGLRKSDTIAADVMRAGLGPIGAMVVSLIVCCAALSTMNASIFTGARLYHALGQDLSLERLQVWDAARNNPRNAIILQSVIAMTLVFFGAIARDGFKAMVEYTAPVFWFFLLLVGVSFFVLRQKDPQRERPFRVPLYPVVPALFCLICAYLVYSSLVYTGRGALFGVAVLAVGIPLMLWVRKKQSVAPAE
ncbi:APC family permease [Pseudorhodoplanes sinuspersici]|uniref:Amino acid permease n=1 Tax=Pseudorhodoplanes sinuspersici TaxID=1235591 RepID=A0A1W7A080_9HYPH|nr:amino acid permease [Pseudorhodoplanes sinuspersici]ARQ03013.1 amino acid permease [Pseudorhodoplanes sinuspersici]RKE67317.1 amino acid/polyamine/organocation transporter (APC superfamily) [Pseudorhodoplanes sinuspersici]